MTEAPWWFTEHYARLNIEDYQRAVDAHERALQGAKSASSAIRVLGEWDALRSSLFSQRNYANTYFSLDSSAERARTEQEFWDQNAAGIHQAEATFARAVLYCPELEALRETFGEQFIRLKQCVAARSGDPHTQELFTSEAQLVSRYTSLLAQPGGEIAGKSYNPLNVRKLFDSPNSDTRREAWQLRECFVAEHGPELDEILDQLVACRTKMAHGLGFANYVALGHLVVERIGYDVDDVRCFTDGVRDFIVPVSAERFDLKRRRLGVSEFSVSDELASEPGTESGVLVSAPEMLDTLARVLAETAPELEEFVRAMKQSRLFYSAEHPRKTGQCQCAIFPDLRMPFVIADVDTTTKDAWALLHEFGHAFHAYRGRNAKLIDLIWPTSEACELAAQMSSLCLPRMTHFFGTAASANLRRELERRLLAVSLGALMNDFQERLYREPQLTPRARRQLWARLEREHMPWRKYTDLPTLHDGAALLLIPHLFVAPFSGLDFALSITCDLQFQARTRKYGQDAAARDYLAYCDQGGAQAFPELLRTARLDSPFERRTLQGLGELSRALLDP
jgi:M3 family oligoendopeptidase